LRWKGPIFSISALTREGCEPLVRAIYEHVARHAAAAPAERDPRFDEADPSVERMPVGAPAGAGAAR